MPIRYALRPRLAVRATALSKRHVGISGQGLAGRGMAGFGGAGQGKATHRRAAPGQLTGAAQQYGAGGHMWKRNGGRISRGLRALERAGYVKLRRDYDGTFCEWTEAGVRAGWASRATLT